MAFVFVGCAAQRGTPTATADALVGTWRVDLRPAPDAEPYYKDFLVERVDGRTFVGSFYDTPTENARINTVWGQVHFAFTTSDGKGVYNTSGTLVGDRLQGTTHSIGREFLAVWTAERTK